MLKLILYEPSVFVHKAIIYTFINQGIMVKLAINKKHMNELARTIDGNVVLVCADPKDTGIMESIQAIKSQKSPKTRAVFPIVDKLETAFLKQLKKAGSDGLIFKTKNPAYIPKQVMLQCDINDFLKGDYAFKKGIHIQPIKSDFAQVSIRTSEIFQTLTADVVDVSVSNLIFRLRERPDQYQFKKNTFLKKMFIFLKNYKVEASGLIVGVQKMFIATRINEISSYDHHALSMYIHDNIDQVLFSQGRSR